MVRLALVGVGGYGWQICGAIRQAAAEGKCKLVGAADVRLADMPLRAQELAAEGVELFDDALDMFARLRGRCDAVYICAGVPSHLPLTAAAATAGYHIHLEKPPAATVQEADQIANVVERAGVLCTLGFHGVYGQTMRFIKDRLVSGNLGRIRSLTAWALLPRPLFYYKRNDWAGKLKLGGQWVLDGPATNAMSHEINAMLFLSGRTPAGYATPNHRLP